jgi:hypothetical protein
MIYKQEDDPNPFPEGMNYAVGDGDYASATYFKTNKEAQAFLKSEQDYSDSMKIQPSKDATIEDSIVYDEAAIDAEAEAQAAEQDNADIAAVTAEDTCKVGKKF